MSSDQEFQDLPSDDDAYEDYDPTDFIDDDDDPPIVAPVASAPAPAPAPTRASGTRSSNSAYQPAPQSYHDDDDDDDQDGGGHGAYGAHQIPTFGQAARHGLGRYINPNAFQAGFGGHAFARPPASAFRRQYRAYSTAILEVQRGRSYGGGRSNLMYGGKITMPPSALEEITQLDIELPITFEITNPAQPELTTHVGVLEFIADEGTVNLPQWIMDQLRLNEGDPIRIWGGRYPKGKMIKIQPQSVDFLEVSDPKAVLEQALRHFSCLSAGDIIEIGYQSLTFRLLIMEITPPGPAISIIDTDVEVDFAAPLGYVEPEYVPRGPIAGPTMKDKYTIDTKGVQDVDARGSGSSTPVSRGGAVGPDGAAQSWEAFKGSGNSLSGKRIKGKGVKAKKIEAVDENSMIFRTDQPRMVTADTQIGERQVPAALNLPLGSLFFGFEPRPPPGSEEDIANKLKAEAESTATPVPFAGVGSGSTLSGRARNSAALPQGAPTPPPAVSTSRASSIPASSQPKVFSGSGNTLSGKKPIETIEID
ncbi:BQ2448_2567 [Microbotryum intermedium]|uniref:BQ2448_2567 protein n=1 Tax=Microbotryum intermedium TaxID=269621 RepID=A0A238F8U0_9BASI|nr:BQ2448_2567 [Microbotryum intermedium]